jgi:4-aminobutyrate aminotransferase/(S)-3-amino-2-methylpropionate transaminase
MLDRLNELDGETEVVADIRGRGAMVAMELAEPGSLQPLPDLTKRVAARCAEQGVVVLTAGTYGNVLRLLPPLVIGHDLLSEGMGVLSQTLLAEAGR